MDPVRFDTLVKSLPSAGTRRSLLRLLAAVPMAAGLLPLLAPEEAQGRDHHGGNGHKGGNGHNGSKGHNGNNGKGKDGKGGKSGKRGTSRSCTPQERSRTCQGRCGSVPNNCGQSVECSCPAGEICRSDGTCSPCDGNNACPSGCTCSSGSSPEPGVCVEVIADPCPLPNCFGLSRCADPGAFCVRVFCGELTQRCIPKCRS
jgi:hypothetical protein